ncbi:type 1 glutamine amidotransferase domain-containing protein [Rhodococcus gannanensis]|uniref:Type 1 glutamine amidotransferase domain-containing protein n=1 Tax=Rhodococcus gannanensis TaxID=1960308 RepID=A0ABW4P5R4_9NOCA
MTDALRNRKVAFLVAPEGTEQVELTDPWASVRAAGGSPVLVSTDSGSIQAFRHLDRGDSFPVDAVVSDVGAADFDALVLPGGVANPDFLRMQGEAVQFVRDFFDAGKPVAVICHGPWTLVEAGVLAGRTVTSWPSLRTDIRNAGGNWVDEQVVVCREGPTTLISSRNPRDLPDFCRSLVEEFSVAPTIA